VFGDTLESADSVENQPEAQSRTQGNKAKEKDTKSRTPPKKVEQKRT
jgi:hypothetical protein